MIFIPPTTIRQCEFSSGSENRSRRLPEQTVQCGYYESNKFCRILSQLIFRRSSIFRHVAAVEKHLLALAGQLQLTGCQVVTSVGSLGMDLALSVVMTQRREVKNMKIATSFLAALLFTGTLGALNNAIAEDGILSKDQLTGTSYCHEKFPAIRQSTLGDDQPELKDSSTADMIDFYGPRDENPAGKDQVQTQRLEDQHRWEMEYSD